MARARNIKPGFFRNADLVELSFEDRLLFIGLWTLADRDGRLEDRPKQIKMELFPADSVDCNAMLDNLAATGMVARYVVDGKRYLQVVNFSKHQNPHRDERASTIPDQHGNMPESSKHDANTVQAPCKPDANTVLLRLNPDSLIPDSQTEQPSVAKATADAPLEKSLSEKSKTELWQAAVSLLAGQGVPEPQARTLIGKLSKDYKSAGEDIVFTAVQCAVSAQPADARAYLKATCQMLAGQRKHAANTETFKERDDRLAAERIAEFMPGIAAKNGKSGVVIDINSGPFQVPQIPFEVAQ